MMQTDPVATRVRKRHDTIHPTSRSKGLKVDLTTIGSPETYLSTLPVASARVISHRVPKRSILHVDHVQTPPLREPAAKETRHPGQPELWSHDVPWANFTSVRRVWRVQSPGRPADSLVGQDCGQGRSAHMSRSPIVRRFNAPFTSSSLRPAPRYICTRVNVTLQTLFPKKTLRKTFPSANGSAFLVSSSADQPHVSENHSTRRRKIFRLVLPHTTSLAKTLTIA
ncbi:hypothetical protein FB567DRAFT_579365 [Paraphoma chrysanthemicola]|uniref:Uncharacterized protein n=1 Tax=Paraphoma chrysanthemicola TaxID=798071 RepID=A0A8K0R7P9_9PLEO|nr:hypothetical protein FB567DRAFT_579365 [Paraphoma chrysanthemicola]